MMEFQGLEEDWSLGRMLERAIVLLLIIPSQSMICMFDSVLNLPNYKTEK